MKCKNSKNHQNKRNMNRVVIVTVSVDCPNAKEVCEKAQNKDFKSTREIYDYFYKHLEKEDGFNFEVNLHTLTEFIELCNGQYEYLADYFICSVTKNINLSNKEIYKQWEKNVKFDAKVVGDLSEPDSLIIELNDRDYRIGYDKETDKFYFSFFENEGAEQIVSYSDNPNNLEYWQGLVEIIILDKKL